MNRTSTEDVALEMVYRRQRLKRALAWCGSDYHKLIVILYLLGYKQFEIADVLGVSPQAISNRILKFCHCNGIAVKKGGKRHDYYLPPASENEPLK